MPVIRGVNRLQCGLEPLRAEVTQGAAALERGDVQGHFGRQKVRVADPAAEGAKQTAPGRRNEGGIVEDGLWRPAAQGIRTLAPQKTSAYKWGRPPTQGPLSRRFLTKRPASGAHTPADIPPWHEEKPDKSTGAANPSRRTFLRRSIPLVPATLAAASGAGAVAVASSAANHLPEVPGPRVDPQLGAAASYTPSFFSADE